MIGIERLRLPAMIMFLITAGFSVCRSLPAPQNGLLNAPSDAPPSSPPNSLALQTTGGQAGPPLAENPPENLPACSTEERMLKIRGDSLAGLIEDGAVMKIIMGYYKCHEIGRGDIVIYNYPGGDPLAKIAKGTPGDKFRLKKSGPGCWNILINGKILKNSEKTPYCVDEHAWGMLSLYEKSYKGIIPVDACLILGNLPGGSMDSTRFGLIGRADILGKAVPLGR